MEIITALLEAAQQQFGDQIAGLNNLTWEDIPEAARNFILARPGLTAIEFVAILVALCPGMLFAAPITWVGFGAARPIAGSLAATYQSVFGTTAGFSLLQSAGMAGVGTSGGMLQGAAGLGVAAMGWFKGNGTGGA